MQLSIIICNVSITDDIPHTPHTLLPTLHISYALCVGVAVILRHLRPDSSCGNGFRELNPIDQNLQYDFNFQQANYLTQAVNVLPVN